MRRIGDVRFPVQYKDAVTLVCVLNPPLFVSGRRALQLWLDDEALTDEVVRRRAPFH